MKKAAQATPNWRLRQERERRCWSQLEVADQIGTTSFNISRWERGITFPTAHFRQQLCALFGKSAAELGLLLNEAPADEKVDEHGEVFPQRDATPSRIRLDTGRPWNVPFRRNPFFTGRGQLLERLHEQLHNSGRIALNQPQALTGLGGIGKTQTVIEYAHRYRDEYTAVFWVRAASQETLVADFVTLAQLLSLPDQDVQDQAFIVKAVKRWLAQNEGWLLILDNADELAIVRGFLPGEGKGHVLLTSRMQATGTMAESLAVEKLEVSEGMQLLLRRAKLLGLDEPLDNVSRTVREQALALAEELDGLPLALEQAAAYIEETGCRLEEYLKLYQRRRSALLKRQSSVPTDYPDTVGSTWSLSFRVVEQESVAAADILRLCAYLAPDAIPEEIITDGASELGPILSPVAADPLLLNEAIQVLRRYSLVKRSPEAKLLNLHRLVQMVLKDGLDQQNQQQWAERAIRAVNAAFPEVDFDTWSRCESCLPHVHICASLVKEYGFTFPEAARLLDLAGYYSRERGLYEQSEPLLQQALDLREQLLGPVHPDTATTLHRLAGLYYYQGRYEQAEPLYLRALAIREEHLGPTHPDTATSLNDVSWLYKDQGKYAQAEPLYLRALAIREQVFGPLHPETAITLNDLAVLYSLQGKYEQAEPLLQRAIAIEEKEHGPSHPNITGPLCNLATLYRFEGKYEQAEYLLQRTITIEEKALGLEHPDLATSLNNLGMVYSAQGKYQQAEQLYQRALAIREQKHGREHQRTAATLDNLATLYSAQDRYEQAEPLLLQALAIREQKLGQTHPDVALSLYHLAGLYSQQSQYKQAIPLFKRALAIREQVLGPSHPDTIKVREHYSELLRTMDRKVTTDSA